MYKEIVFSKNKEVDRIVKECLDDLLYHEEHFDIGLNLMAYLGAELYSLRQVDLEKLNEVLRAHNRPEIRIKEEK